jgi:hypothetical protein
MSKKNSFSNTTLDSVHKKKIEEFSKYEKNLQLKEKKLAELLEKKNFKNTDKIKELEDEISELKIYDPELDYFDKTGDLIIEYYQTKNKKTENPEEKNINIMDILGKKPLNNSTHNKIFTDYIKRIEGDNLDSYDGSNRILKCEVCGIEKTYYASEGCYICVECGDMEEIIIDDEYVIKDISCYHRVGRFKEWLNQFQAKESTDIKDEEYKLIENELRKRRIYDWSNLNREILREILRDLELTKFYDHVPFIISRLNGIPAPKISYQLEKELILMFEKIEKVYPLCKTEHRKNMISYSYLLHKLFELKEFDDLLRCFPLNKSQDVLREQDEIWQRICKHLNWEFYSSFK